MTNVPVYLPTPDDYRAMATFRRRGIEFLSSIYVTQDDILLVKVWSPGATSQVNVSLRFHTPDGEISPTFYTYSVSTVGSTPAQQVIDQVEAFLLSATVETPGAPYGQCYVQLMIVRGRGSGDQTAGQLLCAGYPGAGFAIGFPQTPAGGPLTGAGQAVTSTVANPAAGADWTYTVPAGVTQTLLSVRAVMVNSSGGGTITTLLRITSPTGQIMADVSAVASQTVGTTVTYVWLAGAQGSNVNNVQTMSLPTGLRLMPGSTIQTITTGIGVTDQWQGISISYTQFISA